MTLMTYAFDQLNLNRLDGEWLLTNTVSKQLYEKCGWHEEGVKKQAVYRDGKYQDLAFSGILKEDFDKVKNQIKR